MKKSLIVLVLLLLSVPVLAGSVNTFFNDMIKIFRTVFGTLTSIQRASIIAISKSFERYGDGDRRKLIYIIALAYHESRLRPIKEYKAQPGSFVWDNYQINYWNTGYYGRGFVQLTWKDNYRKMSEFLGVDLVSNPDLALKTNYAADIIVYGMMNGSFTGKKLGDYINDTKADYYNARRTVGAIMVAGKDTAAIIEGYTSTALNIV